MWETMTRTAKTLPNQQQQSHPAEPMNSQESLLPTPEWKGEASK